MALLHTLHTEEVPCLVEKNESTHPLLTLDLGVSYVEGLPDTQLVANYIQSALGLGKGQANEVQGQLS